MSEVLSIVDMDVDVLRAPRPQTHRKLAIRPGLEGMSKLSSGVHVKG